MTRAIPQEVLDQLAVALPSHHEPVQLMVRVLQTCGLRINEVCTLPWECVHQDAEGDWFLRYQQHKLKQEHIIPITRELGSLLSAHAQAQRVIGTAPPRFLFMNAKGGAYRPVSVIKALNTLGYTHEIRDANGQLWRFQPHQFRHTLGTQMINNGVPQHIVQRYLGHASPEMTSRYALVHDETLKAAFQQFHGRLIDIHGHVIPAIAPVDAPALQWFKRQIFAQALPNGYCGLPVMAGPCPHANACLTCTHFRTDQSFLAIHQEQLTATERLIAHARSQGWTRQAEMNAQIKTNLETIIIALEETRDVAPTQHDGSAPECPGAAPGGADSYRDSLTDDAADGTGD